MGRMIPGTLDCAGFNGDKGTWALCPGLVVLYSMVVFGITGGFGGLGAFCFCCAADAASGEP